MSPERLTVIFDLAHRAFHLAIDVAAFFLNVPPVPGLS
jgi:hypothetical protein